MDLARIDLLSLGSFVTQEIVLSRPDLVRRIVLASAAHVGQPGCTAGRWDIHDHALLQRTAAIEQPVFVANGDSDPMILPRYSYLLAGPPQMPG